MLKVIYHSILKWPLIVGAVVCLMLGVGMLVIANRNSKEVRLDSSEQFPTMGQDDKPQPSDGPPTGGAPDGNNLATATFGSGCFWCTEIFFEQLAGVQTVESGYAGGFIEHPSYESVCSGTTGHAEVVQVRYDPSVVSYTELLEVFWRSHDPTTLNRQGPDTGTQYRSVIFYHNDQQRTLAESYKRKLDDAGVYSVPIVTEISPLTEFYPAEEDHQDFYQRNSRQPYCRYFIGPKLAKFQQVFREKLKKAD